MIYNEQLKLSTDTPITIAIIGCGASGTVTLNYLIDYYKKLKINRPVEIHVFEKSKTLSVGIAYGTSNDEHILNMRNGTIDIFSDKPGHFIDWLNTNATTLQLSKKARAYDSFLPRRIVGLYLKESLDSSVRRAKQAGINLTFIHEEIHDFREISPKQRLYFRHTHLDVDYTIFCLGNLPSTNYPEFYDVSGYFHTPWELGSLSNTSAAPIGILGASLTAVDTLISLAPITNGPLYFISPSGRLPKVLHIKKPFTPQFVTEDTLRSITRNYTRKLRLSDVFELFKKEIEAAVPGQINWNEIMHVDDDPLKALQADIERAEKGENHWHTILADTSPLIPRIWENLREKDKKLFYRRFYHIWRIYRVSMPMQNAKKVHQLLKSGRLTIIRNVDSIDYNPDEKLFTIVYRPKGRTKTSLKVPYLIDATGTGFDITKSRSKLIQTMLTTKLLSPHPMGGVRVNPKTLRLIKQDGKELKWTFFFGMLTKGTHFYTNALDANAVHAQKVAHIIMSDIHRIKRII